MSKGYLIAFVKVKDANAFASYAKAVGPILKSFDAKMVVAAPGDIRETANGAIQSGSKTVMIEFESFNQAKAFYDTPEYQEAIKLRIDNSDSTLVLAPGVE